jgi:formate dehydrogenase subunit delta
VTASWEADVDYEQSHLIKMANQISANVPDRRAVADQVAAHLRNFWTPLMRRELQAIADDYPDLLVPDVHAALVVVRRT